MQGARFLVFPSMWYEGFPMTIAEAFAGGLPVVAAQLGSMAEIVQGGVTGPHFEPGNAADLAAKVEWAWEHPEELARMVRAARARCAPRARSACQITAATANYAEGLLPTRYE
jgi:glycosyltransferase involved in cell wall biosynthesis